MKPALLPIVPASILMAACGRPAEEVASVRDAAPTVRWMARTEGRATTTPAIAPDGTVHVTTDSHLYAFDAATGAVQREHYLGGRVMAAAVVGDDGTVYVFQMPCLMSAFGPEGSGTLWDSRLGEQHPGYEDEATSLSLEGTCSVRNTPALTASGVFLVGNTFGSLFTVEAATGGTRARFFHLSVAPESPAIVLPNGGIVMGDDRGVLRQFDESGTESWTFQLGEGRRWGSLAAMRDDTVVAAGHGALRAIRWGEEKWRVAGEFVSAPSIARDGTIYVASATALHALTADGAPRWQAPIPGSRGVALAEDGTIYTGGAFGTAGDLYALRPDGTVLWKLPADARVASGPAIGLDGTVYFATSGSGTEKKGTVYAVAQSHGALMRSSWPKVHGGLGNTGRASTP